MLVYHGRRDRDSHFRLPSFHANPKCATYQRPESRRAYPFRSQLSGVLGFFEELDHQLRPRPRDTDLAPTNFLPCTGQYALCFESGPEPLPCQLTPDGRFATCKCVVKTGITFVLITAILNEKVYQETVEKCGPTGAGVYRY